MPADFDAIVIGGGHNGLVCAAYLARAGERVLVLERHEEAGGCVATSGFSDYPAISADIGGLEHGVFASSSSMRELELGRFGLEYLARDHIYTFVGEENASWLLHRDRARTIASIHALSPADARAFERFSAFSEAVISILTLVSDRPPPDVADLADLARASGHNARKLMQTFLSSPRQVVDSWFDHPHIRAGLINYATHAQTPPWQLGSGYAPCLALGGQGQGGKRPRGGGKSLVSALVACLEHHGGTVRLGARAARILVRQGRAVGVELEGGEQLLARRAVVSAVDARRVFSELVDEHEVPSAFLRSMRAITSGRDNIGEMSMACVLSEPPELAVSGMSDDALLGTFWQGGKVEDIENTFVSIKRGRLPERPNVMWAVPTVLDTSRIDDGRHLLWLAGFVPYELADGRSWDAVREEAGDLMLRSVATAAPNIERLVLARTVMSPVDWHRRTGNLFGNADHVDTGIDQMLGNRPSPLVARYRTPIHGLYLTGAGTHPGGGITGDPGRNTARTVLADLGLAERQPRGGMGRAAARIRTMIRAALVLRRFA